MAEARKTPVSSVPQGGGTPQATSDTKSEQRGPLKQGELFSGRVVALGDNLYSVQVDGSSQVITNVQCSVGICAGLFGYRTYVFWDLGDWVSVVYGAQSFIVGSAARDNPDMDNPNSRTHTGFGLNASTEPPGPNRRNTPVNDLVSGEYEISNLLGMALVMATNFISLKAGDRAKVDVGIANGLVRIVSEQFKHHSAFGDLEIFNDGRNNVIFEGSSYPWETDGKLTKTDEDGQIQLTGNQVDLTGVDFTEALRSRFTAYVGWLGDMVRLFVTEPTQAANQIGQQAFAAGRASFWVGTSGDMLVSSVGEIAVEHVHRILVPRRKKRHEDKTGNVPEDFDDPSKMSPEMLKPWKVDPSDLCASMFQLREYARWFSQIHALRRFRQASEDWDVPTEDSSPLPDNTAHEDDVKQAGGEVEVIVRYATVRIMRDGSIIGRNGWGSSLALAGEDAYLSAPRNLYLEAGGDIQATAGRDFLVKARRSIELVAIRGGIILYAKTWLRCFCELGSAWFRSSAPDPAAPGYVAAEVEEGDPAPEVLDHAVFIEATQGKTSVRSKRQIRIQTFGPKTDDDSVDVILDASGNATIRGGKNVTLNSSDGFIAIQSSRDLLINCNKSLYFQASFVDFFRTLTYKEGKWNFTAGIAASFIDSMAIASKQIGFKVPDESRSTVGAHYNHIRVVADDFEVGKATDEEMAGLSAMQNATAVPAPSSQGPLWGFQPPEDYQMAGAKRYESHAQQALHETAPENYASWSWGADRAGGPGIDSSRAKPWGSTYRFQKHRGGTPFATPQASAPGNAATSWSSSPADFQYYKSDPT